jgi:hypothetical protein
MNSELDHLNGVLGDTVMVGLHVTVPSDTHFISTEMTLTGFQDRLNFISLETPGSLAGDANWTVVSNSTDTSLYIAAAGANGISGAGMMFWVKLAIPDNDSTGLVPIHVESVLFNSGGFNFNVSDGSVNVINDLVTDFSATTNAGAYPLASSVKATSSG